MSWETRIGSGEGWRSRLLGSPIVAFKDNLGPPRRVLSASLGIFDLDEQPMRDSSRHS
jgi:hypothetical protein